MSNAPKKFVPTDAALAYRNADTYTCECGRDDMTAREIHMHYVITGHYAFEPESHIMPGDTVIDFHGDAWKFEMVTRAYEPGRSAKVRVSDDFGKREFYATVFPALDAFLNH